MAYASLQLGLPGTLACPDAYDEDQETWLLCPRSTRLILQVSVQAVYVQLGTMAQITAGFGGVTWQPEQPFLPVVASLGRKFDAVRVRNYTRGAEAQVMLSVETT